MSGRRPYAPMLALAVALASLLLPPAAARAAEPIPLPPPGQPVAAEITTTSAVLTWTPSAGPVFRYSMKQLVNGAWQGYASMPFTSFKVAGLSPDTEYTFAVYSVALFGSGYTLSPLSEPVTFRTLAQPATAGTAAQPGDSPAPAVQDTWSCQARITLWNGFYTASVTLVWAGPTSTPWAWTATFTLPPTLTLDQGWNATFVLSGRFVSVSGGSWSGGPIVPPGTPIGWGFSGRYTGAFEPPRDFRIGDTPCEIVVIGPPTSTA